MQSSPVLSVGIPVFNGSKWIEEAIGSILSQSFTDFELIICDNASSDETEKISRQAASADARIRYYRNATNIGVYANYDRVFELSTGRYFKWAACSDLCLQDFFEKCVAALDALPDAVLAYPRAYMLVTAPGTGEYAVEYEDNQNLEFERPSRRFAEYLDRERFNNVMNGVIRSSALRGTALNRPLPGSDISMIAELALRGKFVEIPDRLFVRRFNPETTGILMDSETSRAPAIGYPGKPNNIQRIRLHSYRFVTAFRAPISFAEKLRVWRYLLRRIIRLAPQVRRKLLQIVTPGG